MTFGDEFKGHFPWKTYRIGGEISLLLSIHRGKVPTQYKVNVAALRSASDSNLVFVSCDYVLHGLYTSSSKTLCKWQISEDFYPQVKVPLRQKAGSSTDRAESFETLLLIVQMRESSFSLILGSIGYVSVSAKKSNHECKNSNVWGMAGLRPIEFLNLTILLWEMPRDRNVCLEWCVGPLWYIRQFSVWFPSETRTQLCI